MRFLQVSTALLAPALGLLMLVAPLGPSKAQSPHAPLMIQQNRILLGDLSATLPEAVSNIDVGPAPAPGKHARVTRAGIRHALKRAGADPSLADSLPGLIDVKRAAKPISAQDLRAQIQASLLPQLPKGVSIARINSVTDLALPVGPHRVQSKLGPLRSSTTASVKIYSGAQLFKTIAVQLVLSGTPKLPVLTQKVSKNAVVTQDQVKMQPTQWSQVNARSALFSNQLVGKRALAPLAAGQVLPKSALKLPPMIARGSEISVLAVGKGLRIVMPATAQQDGQRGQYIRVQPRSGTRPLRALVVSPNEVRIDLELSE